MCRRFTYLVSLGHIPPSLCYIKLPRGKMPLTPDSSTKLQKGQLPAEGSSSPPWPACSSEGSSRQSVRHQGFRNISGKFGKNLSEQWLLNLGCLLYDLIWSYNRIWVSNNIFHIVSVSHIINIIVSVSNIFFGIKTRSILGNPILTN